MRWSFKDSKLAWYEYGWAMLPVVLLVVGGAVGGLCAAAAIACNLYVMRSRLRPVWRYSLAGLATVAAAGAYLGVAGVISVRLITAESVDRDLQKTPVFVALKKADPAVYAKLVEQLTDVRKRTPAAIKAATSEAMTTVVDRLAPHASDQAVIDRARVLALELDQIGAENTDACFSFLYPGQSPMTDWRPYISSEVTKFEEAAVVSVLETGATDPKPVPEQSQVQESLRQVAQRLVAQFGEDAINMLGKEPAVADRAKLCALTAAFYKEVLSLPRVKTVQLLRFLFAKRSAA
jgi:hypothetical protein